MATVVANKPAPPHQKLKRPPTPAVQTNANGIKSSQSSPSPSLTSKRPPLALKHPPSATTANGVSGSAIGAGSRLSNRRRESQKPGDIQTRTSRPNKSTAENIQDRRKKMAEPFVKTPAFILKKFRKAVPSLVIHLHPTHFRFDQQDGSFSYNSPMKIILEHLKLQTVPHDMVEELLLAGVKFYDGCLIVQVQDHRKSSNSQATETTASTDRNVPFSIHNYNKFITPSPYVPYPSSSDSGTEVKLERLEDNVRETIGSAAKDKQREDASRRLAARGPKVFTTVLFPTPLSLEEEVFVYSNMPDPRSNNRKQSQAGSLARTPASATVTHPPTPLSAASSASINPPPNKKQKMLVKENDIRPFQSKLVNTTAAPLYLDPVHNLQEAYRLIRGLTDSLHKGDYPAPKTRKRTVAELEADEALAASDQRFMLIMDERLGSTVASAAGKSSAADGEAGAAAFEPRFERFKAIEAIKVAHKEKERLQLETKAHQQANKLRQEQMDQKLANERKIEAAKRESHLRAYQAAQHQQANLAAMQKQQQQQYAAAQNSHAHGPTSNSAVPNQQAPSSSQPQHSSPVVRQMTPHSNPRSSPLVGSMPTSHTPHSVPMNVTSSGQGATSSPARPPSAVQLGHPGGVAMVHQRSQQQPPSRMGTPQMPNGTPNMQHVTPVMNHARPMSRMSQASPPNGIAHTPVMNQNGITHQHLAGQQISNPEQHQHLLRFRAHQIQLQQQQQFQQQQQQQQQHQQQQQMAHMSPNHQMSPNPNLQQLAAHNQQRQYDYPQHMNNHQRQMQGVNGAGGQMSNGVSPPHLQSHPNGTQQPRPLPGAQQQQQMSRNATIMQYQMNLQNDYVTKMKQSLSNQYGGLNNIPPEKINEAKQHAHLYMQRSMAMKRQQMLQTQNQNNPMLQQQRREAAMMLAGQSPGMNGMGGMNGVNGMGGMGGMGGVGGNMNGMGQ